MAFSTQGNGHTDTLLGTHCIPGATGPGRARHSKAPREGQATFLELFEPDPCVQREAQPERVWGAVVSPDGPKGVPLFLQRTMWGKGDSNFISPRGCCVERFHEANEDGMGSGEHIEVDQDLMNFDAEAFFKLGPQQRLA